MAREELGSVRRADVARTRQAAGRDLFTGELLTGENALQWLRHWSGLPAEFVPTPREGTERDFQLAELLGCTDDHVQYRRTDGKVMFLERTVGREVVKGRGVPGAVAPHGWPWTRDSSDGDGRGRDEHIEDR